MALDGAVNVGLRGLGVRARPGEDEYDAIELTRHRHTEDWLIEALPRPDASRAPDHDERAADLASRTGTHARHQGGGLLPSS